MQQSNQGTAERGVQRFRTRVEGHRPVSPTAFELTMARPDFPFRAGQLLLAHGPTLLEDRSYTVCSGEDDPQLQIVYRLIPEGKLTPELARLRPGDFIDISGPFGEFTLRDISRPIVFVATGTGIAPCRSFSRSNPGLNLSILHGVRRAEDLFYRDELSRHAYYPCASAEEVNGFKGRVTDFFRQWSPPDGAHFYLCGANEMFYEMRDLLTARGVPGANIFTEAYYYRSDE